MRADRCRTFPFSITESQIIAAVITFAVLFCSYVMDGISSFFSSTSSASFMTFLVISVLIALVVYQMTKDMILSSVLGIVLIAVNVVLYIVKSALYEGLIQKLLDLLSIANHFDSFVGGILDVSGSFICYRLSAFLFFLPFSVYKNGVGAKFGKEMQI